uniref:AIG1-type G domain-containing protein n=1 Tax=Neogobius melanostomus TaxID=47308 RepID=A0A8C6UY74_9GOBI
SDNKTPENYKPILYKNTLISEGPPSVWQLAPQKKRSGNVTRVKTVGFSEEASKSVRTVLLLGETGSGKSTFINALFNFAIGVKWEENIWFEIIDKGSGDQTESQTSEVTVYEINADNLDFSLRVIDTPGLGDTRGSEKLLTERLLDLFQSEDGVSEVHAVALVLKASENRLTDRMAYVFNSVTSLFNKDMEQKIVPLFTHSDGRKPNNALKVLNTANVKFARDEKNEPVCFMFDNCQRDDRTNGTEYPKLAYDSTNKNIQNFMKFLQQESKHLKGTVKVLKERISLRESIEKLKDQVQKVKEKEKEIQQAKQGLDKYEMKMESTKNSKIEIIEMFKEKVPVEGGWMPSALQSKEFISCTKCEVTCYGPGSKQERLKNSRCSVCPGNFKSNHFIPDFFILVE